MVPICYTTGAPRKGLRVSSPLPNTAQRSTYFLSLPYKWAIPCTAAKTTLHWLVSQMHFFARVDIYKLDAQSSSEIQTVGRIYWSQLAGVNAICLGGTMLVGVSLTALLKHYPDRVPLSGCCSASIAAACHPSRIYDDDTLEVSFDPELSSQKLGWGVVEASDEVINGNIGHATFAATKTLPLVEEQLYA
ncbi:hypothetical protein N7492_007631 [Penicillium capsulatum]|uniref:Uncharacterized protein n=1 Tax=Penicillium capsulatum TaxID=69766 RepID=A0A9W9I093_9EURO|nr:hypothetical protein N7492_007631 [Penicillium capsulatum]KAJ6117465.1 hypothetical protein N7512_007190 [Penicillium capsulatum]